MNTVESRSWAGNLTWQTLFAFTATVVVALFYAFFTDHRWEDWYITFRAAKNLALGNGLVFAVGERVHSFTSPIGTLLPALFSYLFGPQGDEGALWAFRVASALALGGAAAVLECLSRSLGFAPVARLLLLGMFSTNILIVDFSINGMETAFMMLFLVLLVQSILVPGPRQILRVALAVAGLMYTRPDGFVYAGTLMLAAVICAEPGSRKGLVAALAKGTGIAVVAYLPWTVFTWSYYGTPIPHTVTAKGLNRPPLGKLVMDLVTFPWTFVWERVSKLYFLPPYSFAEGFRGWWPLHWISMLPTLAVVASMLLPGVGRRVRIFAIAVFVLSFYLHRISGQGAMPWYLPNVAVLVVVGFALLMDNWVKRAEARGASFAFGTSIAAACLIFSLTTLTLGAVSMRVQQQVIEFDHRKQIGLWLAENARKGDTVFLECLGYIGFFSGLKTYDYPGMSSPEMVAARRKLGRNRFGPLIRELEPTWLVLRPPEERQVERFAAGLLGSRYVPVKIFDASPAIDASAFPFGKPYMSFDAKFTVFKRVD